LARVAENRRNDAYVELARLVQVVVDYRTWMMRGGNYPEPVSPTGPEGWSKVGTLVEIYGSRPVRTLTHRFTGEWNAFSAEMRRSKRDRAACEKRSNALAETEKEILRTIRVEVQGAASGAPE